MAHWDKQLIDQASDVPSIIFAKNFARNYEKIVILGTSDAWSMSCLSHWPREPAYYIVDWWISGFWQTTLDKMLSVIALVSVCIQQPFIQLSIEIVLLLILWDKQMDRAQHLGHGHAVKTLPVSTFFCVHSATLDQKNLVHIYPRTYLQLYISSATMYAYHQY